jgi:hypothetical protein
LIFFYCNESVIILKKNSMEKEEIVYDRNFVYAVVYYMEFNLDGD